MQCIDIVPLRVKTTKVVPGKDVILKKKKKKKKKQPGNKAMKYYKKTERLTFYNTII